MTRFRLTAVLLVLLQSVLAAAHVHAHPGQSARHEAPHLHACELLELFTAAHDHEEHEGDHHDADALQLSDALMSPTPPGFDAVPLDLHLAEAGFGPEAAAARRPSPLGLPPSTAGPSAPLYLTFCSFRN